MKKGLNCKRVRFAGSGANRGPLWPAGILLLAGCAGLIAGVSAASAGGADDGQNPTTSVASADPPQTIPLREHTAAQSKEPATAAAGKEDCGDKGAAQIPTPSASGPQPRWVGETTCTIEPIWRGETAEFVFEIGNQGEADLKMKLRPG